MVVKKHRMFYAILWKLTYDVTPLLHLYEVYAVRTSNELQNFKLRQILLPNQNIYLCIAFLDYTWIWICLFAALNHHHTTHSGSRADILPDNQLTFR